MTSNKSANYIENEFQVSFHSCPEFSGNENLLLLLREKDQLIRTTAHDLRNPLGSITSLATLLMEENKLSEDQNELLDAIKLAASYSLKLVEGLLTIKNSDLETIYRQDVNIHELIKNYLRFSKHLIDRKNQTVLVNFFEGDIFLKVDKEKITRVVDNLIGNAMKFTPQFGEISVDTRMISDGLQIIVKDTGIGIPESLQPYVFAQPKGRRPGTSGEKSHGLGLSICKKIVESYGGTIHFQSRPGKGTKFYIWLPNVHKI
ncbi:sensor histidine kinase [Mucilaginibacter glaciei]|uniref:histidine kinase n=1 Tax=Mucilaginibacter glaciei TaxID=2772109 RepID=A0A926S3K1_9SPHI|nr:HAMP domain-containing sensor histidine kinase [Mucilaginibacter glaciei]MBD1395303.1 HAMP domain-containing histidine kinase [Mucilaginibacter glaciei]